MDTSYFINIYAGLVIVLIISLLFIRFFFINFLLKEGANVNAKFNHQQKMVIKFTLIIIFNVLTIWSVSFLHYYVNRVSCPREDSYLIGFWILFFMSLYSFLAYFLFLNIFSKKELKWILIIQGILYFFFIILAFSFDFIILHMPFHFKI